MQLQAQLRQGSCVLQLWKDLEEQAKAALRQASQHLSEVQQAQDEAARLRWTADTAQRCPS